jgi:hypothetical protein
MENEYSKALITITSSKLQQCIMAIPDDIMAMEVEKLENDLKPTEKQKQLKIMVQHEIDCARNEERNIVKQNMCRGVMHPNNLDIIIENPKMLAWLLIPDVKEEVKTRRIYQDSLEKLKLIMDELFNRWQLKKDVSAAREYHSIFKTIASRAAPIISRQETKIQKIENPEISRRTNDIEDRIAQLERELGKNR